MGNVKYLTVTQYAEKWQVSEYSVRRWARLDLIEHTKIGKAIRIPENAIPNLKGHVNA
nr:MAG: Pyocin activator protein PrtN [Bacteriophage sp.]